MLGGAGLWHKSAVSCVGEESRMCVLNHGDADFGLAANPQNSVTARSNQG